MKKNILFLMCMIAQVCAAQSLVIKDKELASLVDVVKTLRNPSKDYFNQATQKLQADDKWTSMNETGDLQPTECKPSEKIPSFKLNRILTNVAKTQKRVSTTGTMLNGEDARYNYSLYERSLKKGKSATYMLRKRSGKQTFVLVPYIKKRGRLSVLVNGKVPVTTEQEDGTVLCSFDSQEKDISLTVVNKSGSALSFVILNHNSREK